MKTKMTNVLRLALAVGFAGVLAIEVSTGLALAGSGDEKLYEKKQDKLPERHQEYVFGVPKLPTDSWMISSGGRFYDNWADATEKDLPSMTHPSWPATNTRKKGGVTWRCKSCHGWDYKGVNGKYIAGSYKTGIKGVTSKFGASPSEIATIIRDATHGYTTEMISNAQAIRLGMFITRGLHDSDAYIDRETGNTRGSAVRGAEIFQNICASCHGFQGTKLDWGSDTSPKYVGTEANANPWEVLHKIRNGHPGHEMISMRAFSMRTAVDILTYIRTLPEK